MHIRISTMIAAGCLLFLQPAAADIIALKDGKKIKGTVIRKDGDDYIVEVVISGTIKDERRIPRADVKFIEKKADDEKAFEKLGVQLPTPDLLEKEIYEDWIAKLEKFLGYHPKSPRVQAVREMLDTLVSEHAIVAAGGVKIGGEIVTAEEYGANAYEYDEKIAQKSIRNAVARRDFLNSLRKFSEYTERFGESESRQEMNALMLQVLDAYKTGLDQNLATLEKRLERRQSGLATMSPEDRSRTERALKEQMDKIENRFQKEKATRQKWVTPNSFHKESMTEALRNVTSEMTRLRTQREPAPLPMPLAEAYRIAWAKISDVLAEEEKMISELPADGEETPAETAVGKRKPADPALKEKKALEGKKMDILKESKANRLPEFYLEKLSARAALGEN